MQEIETLILQRLLLLIKLHRARMQYGNKYVFGSDDAIRIIENEIIKSQHD